MAEVVLALLAFRGACPNQPDPVFTAFHIKLKPLAAPKRTRVHNCDTDDSMTKHFDTLRMSMFVPHIAMCFFCYSFCIPPPPPPPPPPPAASIKINTPWNKSTEHHQHNTPSTQHHQPITINTTPSTHPHQHNTINTTPSSTHHQHILNTLNHQHNPINTTPSTHPHQHNTINTTPSTQQHLHSTSGSTATPFAWQAQHLEHLRLVLRVRRRTRSISGSFCVAGAALVASPARFAWQAQH